MTAAGSSDIVIIDEIEPCPYLSGEMARMPLRMPLGKISLAEADQRLAEGHRRTGEFIYQTKCPSCNACEPIRLVCDEFRFSRSQRNLARRGDRRFRCEVGALVADGMRVELFNKHRRMRGLAKRDSDIDLDEYIWGFVRSCFESFEITYWLESRLIGVAICDRGQTSLSAVYTFYDPDMKRDSIGTYSILKQIEFCRDQQLKYLYLGYYVEASPHMKYKSRFLPHERLVDDRWVRFDPAEMNP